MLTRIFPVRELSGKLSPSLLRRLRRNSAAQPVNRSPQRMPARPSGAHHPGGFFFRPHRIVVLLLVCAAIWLLSYSGLGGLDL